MRLTKPAISLVIALSLGSTFAQSIDILPATTGSIFDPRQGSLRSLIGVPGSAFLGEPLVTGLTAAWPSPDGRNAIVVPDGVLQDGATAMLPSPTSGPDLLPNITQVVWNAAGTAAALYSATDQTLQCTSLTQSLAVMPLGFLEAPVTSIAVRDCTEIAFANAQYVYLVKEGLAPQRIADLTASALAFAPASLWIATAEGLYRHRAGAIQRVSARTGTTSLAVYRAGQLLALNQQSVSIQDANGNLLREIPLEQPAVSLVPLTNSVFLLDSFERDTKSIKVLDMTNDPAVFFVPTATPGSL